MQITNERTLKRRKFKRLYHVMSLGKASCLEVFISPSKPTLHIYPGKSYKVIKVKKPSYFGRHLITTDEHLFDMNIGRHYNGHKLFTRRKEAEKYLEECKKKDYSTFRFDDY